MSKSETCVVCHRQSPETDTDYTLISAQFGWRLTRAKDPDGGLRLEWRCPACWNERKREKQQAAGDARQSSNPPPQSTTRPSGEPKAEQPERAALTSSGQGRSRR